MREKSKTRDGRAVIIPLIGYDRGTMPSVSRILALYDALHSHPGLTQAIDRRLAKRRIMRAQGAGREAV